MVNLFDRKSNIRTAALRSYRVAGAWDEDTVPVSAGATGEQAVMSIPKTISPATSGRRIGVG
jgi:hypothetical protein